MFLRIINKILKSENDLRIKILRFALPLMGEQFLNSVFILVNSAFVGVLGPLYLAAVGLSHQIIMTIGAVLAIIVVGTTVLISHRIGSGDVEGAQEVAYHSLVLSLIAGIGLGFLAWFFPRVFFIFFSIEEALLLQASLYIKYALGPSVFFVLFLVMSAIFRGSGDTKTPFYLACFTIGLNIFLDYILIFGRFGFPALGVKGTAFAFAFSRALAVLIYLLLLFKRRTHFHLKSRINPFNLACLKRMFTLGFPASIEQVLFTGGLLVFSGIVLNLGTKVYAAHRIALNIESLSFMVGWGFAMGVTVMVGQYRGRGDDKGAYNVAMETLKIGASMMAFIGFIIFLIPTLIVKVFTSDPEVINSAVLVLRIIALLQASLATQFIMAGSLRGAGDTRFPMFTSGTGIWLIRLPLAYFLINFQGLGLLGAWIAMSVDILYRSTVNFLRFRARHWEKIEI